MLILDDRENSNIRGALKAYDVPVSIVRLDYGDACFEGHGPRGPALIAFERKRLLEFEQSMLDRRLSGHQLIGLAQHYDYVHIVIEGVWRLRREGIEVLGGRGWRSVGMTYRQLDSYIASLEMMAGVVVIRTANEQETAAVYASRYHWWQKRWSDHHAHDQIFTRELTTPLRRGRAVIEIREPKFEERVAAQLPGVDRKAWDVAAHFGTVENMVLASKEEWMEIPGIGTGIATNAYNAWRGKHAKT